ncbi:MAG: type IV pilin-like G/H family protein, partial [Leptolyngbyaceae cyanobacterium bins.59]|nr:type IV pilin-like G/H family protein [Leptolyngbyaceae cyanobacterium bins.59]
ILDEEGAIFLVDFGAVQDRARAEGATFTVVGTGGYVPPEQLWGRAVPASDLYALGATLIHLMTGVAPSELPQKQMRLQFRDYISLHPAFAHWLERLTHPASEQRFAQAGAALQDLEAIDHSPIPRINPRAHIPQIRYGSIAGLSLFQYLFLGVSVAIFWPATMMRRDAKTYEGGQKVYYLNMEQQGYFRQHGHFATRISHLAKGVLPSQNEDYKFDTVIKPTMVVNYAVPQRKSLHVHVGAVYRFPNPPTSQLSQSPEATPFLMVQCQAISPGNVLLPDPFIRDGLLQCPLGTEFRDGHPGFVVIEKQILVRDQDPTLITLRGVPLADQADWERAKQFDTLVYINYQYDKAEALAKQVQNPDLRRDLLRRLEGARGRK